MIYTTQAMMKGGDEECFFPINLRTALNFVPYGENPRFRATPIAWSGYIHEKKSDYAMNASLRFHGGTDRLGFHLENVLQEGVVPADVAKKFAEAMIPAEALYARLANFPKVTTIVEGPTVRFEILLPSHSAMYFSEQFFLEALGFSKNAVREINDTDPRRPPKDSAGDATSTETAPRVERVYGLVNDRAGLMKVSGERLKADEPIDLRYLGLKHPNDVDVEAAAASDDIKSVWMDIVFLTKNWLPIALANKRPLNRNAANDVLAFSIDQALRLLNVDPALMNVKPTGLREILIESREFDEHDATVAKFDLELEFSQPLARYLQSEKSITFPLYYDKRSVLLEARDDFREDPLEGYYPLHMVTSSSDTNCEIHGLGTKCLLALMLDRSNFKGEGVVLTGDVQELRLRLLDKALKPIRVRDKTVFTLSLDLVFF
ncbi:MAG: hypothetical protein ABSA72_12395 [Nitrososphaerales archaeon]|jgi:hypothetical protein